MCDDTRFWLLALFLTGTAQSALARQPPDVVQSDAVGNPALGLRVLQRNEVDAGFSAR